MAKAGVETISKESSPALRDEAPCPCNLQGDDIVHPQWEHWDKCKEWVPGSNPGAGALIEIGQEIARFLFYSLGFLRFEPWQSLAWTGVRRF